MLVSNIRNQEAEGNAGTRKKAMDILRKDLNETKKLLAGPADDDREEEMLRAQLRDVQERVKRQNEIDIMRKELTETRKLLTELNKEKEKKGGGRE
jgi:hypothetical protein